MSAPMKRSNHTPPPQPAEAAVLDQLRARVAAGESYRAIARPLAAAGVVNRAGRPFRFRALAR